MKSAIQRYNRSKEENNQLANSMSDVKVYIYNLINRIYESLNHRRDLYFRLTTQDKCRVNLIYIDNTIISIEKYELAIIDTITIFMKSFPNKRNELFFNGIIWSSSCVCLVSDICSTLYLLHTFLDSINSLIITRIK